MAINTITNLFSGGTRPQNASYAMLPSQDTGTLTTTGYADHQRRRSYQVVRQMRFTPRVPYGGLGNYAYTDQKDWEWYENVLVAGGSNVAVDDVWNLIIIPPNTRLEYIAAQVFTGVTGVQFSVYQVDTSGAQIGSDDITGIGDVTEGPILQAISSGDQNSSDLRFLAIAFTAVPGSSGTAKLNGLDFAIQAEVVDWGSYDLNGNA